MVTDDESDIAKNVGGISSARAAELPTEAGLAWTYYDGAAWPADPKMTCTEVAPARRPPPPRAASTTRRRPARRAVPAPLSPLPSPPARSPTLHPARRATRPPRRGRRRTRRGGPP